MSIPVQVLPPALEPSPPAEPPANDRRAADTDDDDDDEFDAERTICQSTQSASSSLYKEDLFAHPHTHGELFHGAGRLGELAEIKEQPPAASLAVGAGAGARRRSSAAAGSRPKKADLVKDEKAGGGGSDDDDQEAQSGGEEAAEPWTYPDGGYKAWATAFGCCLYAGTTMGFGLTWGIFQSYYAANNFRGTDESIITLVGGLCAFTMNATCFLGGRLGDRFGYKRMLTIGSVLSFLSFFIMAWSTEHLWSVFLCQGFLNGAALGTVMPISMSLPSQWFLRRRGLATGIATSGSGLIGGLSSIIVRLLIVRIGPRYTLLVFSFIHGVMYIVAFFMVEVREPPKRYKANGKVDRPWLPRGVWHTGRWYSFCLSIFISVFGFTTPYFFITSYVRDTVPSIDSTSLTVSVPLIVANILGGVGRIGIGFVADKVGPINCFFITLLLGGLSQLCVWQFAHTFDSIVGFAVFFGLQGGLFMSLIPVVAAKLFRSEGNLATIVGFATLCNAPGQFVAGSIGGALREKFNWTALICFSGGMMTLGSTIILFARFDVNKKIFAKV